MKSICFSAVLILCAVHGFCQSANTKIADNALQPAVVINQKNSANIVIACGTGEVSFSMDAGKTWQQGKMPSPQTARGQALLRSNDDGEILLIHDNNYNDSARTVIQLICQTSMSGGKSWAAPSIISHSEKSKSQVQAMVHPKKNRIVVTWTEVDQGGQSDPACQSKIYISQSGDGTKWSEAELLSQEAGDCTANMLEFPSIAIDDDHKMFCSWIYKDNLMMDRTFDGGKTWLNNDMSALKITGAHKLAIPGIGDVNRTVFMTQDNSKSYLKNCLFALWADQRNGADDTDIWFVSSVRRGDLWSNPFRVNSDEKGKHQFMPAMTIDQTTGVIYIVYYDRRAYSDTQTDVYLAWSTNGGDKFSEMKISEKPFTPQADKPFTNSISISAHKGIIVPVWGRMDDGVSSIWTTTILQSDIIKKEELPRQPLPQKGGARPTQQLPTQRRQSN